VISLNKLQKISAYLRAQITENKQLVQYATNITNDINAQVSDLRKQLNVLNVDGKSKLGKLKLSQT
jgi:hypothetical protein